MREENIKQRIDSLLAGGSTGGDKNVRAHEIYNGALSLMVLLYGSDSPQVEGLTQKADSLGGRFNGEGLAYQLSLLARGALQNMRGEIDAGLLASLRKTITGEVLADFLQLARAALDENDDDAKNVAAVLAAALFEDTIRRLASDAGISHREKLQNVIIELKNNGTLQGPQVGIANSYLKFRNDSLHAQWTNIGRESVASVLGFVEQLLIKHFP